MRVGEDDVIDSVVALAANGADAEAVTSVAVHVVDGDVGATGDSNTVILVVNLDVVERDIVAGGNVETVTVVGCSLGATLVVGHIAGGVVKDQIGYNKVLVAGHGEAVNRPVLDVQAGDLCVAGLLDNNEVVGPDSGALASRISFLPECLHSLVTTTVGTQAVPVSSAIALNYVAGCASNCDVGSRDNDRVEAGVDSRGEGGCAVESNLGALLQLLEIDGAGRRGCNVRERDVGA